jgi:hypothetical protein
MRGRLVASLALVALLGSSLSEAATRVRVVHHGPRTKVVVHRGFPLRRPLPHVFVVAPRVRVRVVPALFLPAIVWAPVVVAAAAASELAWEDSQELTGANGWTDFTLSADARGRKLFIEVGPGSVRLNFAEVVFENGDTQVVDFTEQVRLPGLYLLLDFADGRKVDHVRAVAQAESETARVSLRLLT